MSDEPNTLKYGHEPPVGKKVNGFTGELEDAQPLTLVPSPADQRRLAMQDDERPLIDQVRERVDTDTARNVDGAFIAEHETPQKDITQKPLQQFVDVPPTNTQLVQAGHPVEPIELPTVSPSVVSPNRATNTDTDNEATPITEDESGSPSPES